ncbi:MAG: ABC transporter permease subunit, partial [Firmicutes bacterium]|nr:ABC transporter permease subunit [Candidatus Colivicinus equi]
LEWTKLVKKYTLSKILYRLLGFALLLGIWQIASTLIKQGSFILPNLKDTFAYTVKILNSSYLYNCILISLKNLLIGFVSAFICAFIIGVIAGNNRAFKEIIAPLVVTMKSIPTASVVYLFMLLAGIENSPIFIVALVCFPIIYEAIVSGIENIDSTLIDAAKVDGISYLSGNTYIKVPLAIPSIILGISSCFGLGFKIEIMAEIITGSAKLGLGSAIASSQRSDPTNLVPVFAYSLIAILLMFVIDLITSFVKDKIEG